LFFFLFFFFTNPPDLCPNQPLLCTEATKNDTPHTYTYSGVPGSEEYPVARVVRSLQQNLSTTTLPPFNHKQNYSNYITVIITHPVTWEQLFNIATAAAAAADPSTAVAIAAIAAAAALRLALNYRQYASASIEQNRGVRMWKINVPSFDTSVRKAFLSKRFHGITFAPAPDCSARNGTVIDSERIVERESISPCRAREEPSSLFPANTEVSVSSAVK